MICSYANVMLSTRITKGNKIDIDHCPMFMCVWYHCGQYVCMMRSRYEPCSCVLR